MTRSKDKVLQHSEKGTRLRRLALAQVRQLRAAGMSYREIGARFRPGNGGDRAHPAAASSSPAAPSPSPSAGSAATADHRRFLRALDAVPVGLFFIGPSRRVIHVNDPATRMLEMDPGGEQIRREIDAFVCGLTPPEPGSPPPIRNQGVKQLAARELSTAAGKYRLRGSSIGLDLWGTGSTILITLEAEHSEAITQDAIRERFGLTRKEAQVALLLAQRRSTPEIARELHLSPHTVHHHVRHVLEKLGLRSRREVADALEAGRNGVGNEK